MNPTAPVGKTLWRVGYHLDPTAFTPRDLYAYNHRFDDAQRRFRTLYLAEQSETALREVLADLRPNLAAQQRHIERFGPAAAADFALESVTAGGDSTCWSLATLSWMGRWSISWMSQCVRRSSGAMLRY